jgi:hypothetical protein
VIQPILRKLGQVQRDATLRRWLIGRAFGKWPYPEIRQSLPPYLAGISLESGEPPHVLWPPLTITEPEREIELNLAGLSLTLQPGDVGHVFERSYDDTEQLLALHRFNWVTDTDPENYRNWYAVLFRGWLERFGSVRHGWAWHPYTAAERLINCLAFCRDHGCPGAPDQVRAFLDFHGPAIFDFLEYFGEGQTGNHLTNNGRGLFLGGLSLGRTQWVEVGELILLREAERILDDAGLLNEGSSHYHLLVTRWYLDCWLAADEAGRPSAAAFKEIAARMLSAASVFDLPGGLPLIGDVSPDCPPDYLQGLASGEASGWLRELPEDVRGMVMALREEGLTGHERTAATHGWQCLSNGPWTALWHVPANGWGPMPGHAHRDFGGFELHYRDQPVIQDAGRRSYGASGDQDVSATHHSTLLIDGHEPYPVNRAYYSEDFRQSITGAPPVIACAGNEMTLVSQCFSRLQGVGAWERRWRFSEDEVVLSDTISGTGRHLITRYLQTAQPVTESSGSLSLGPVRLSRDTRARLDAVDRWPAYGQSSPATSLQFTEEVQLPWSSEMVLSRVEGN